MTIKEARSTNELLKKVSHELRTPLTSIIGYAEAMLSDARLPAERRRKFAEIIRSEGQRLSNVIDDCLNVAFSSQERILLHRERTDVRYLVHQTVQQLLDSFKALGVECRISMPSTPCFAKVDGLRFQQLLQNLLLNVLRLSQKRGIIEVTMNENEKLLSLSVTMRTPVVSADDLLKEARRDFIWHHAPDVELREAGIGFAFAQHLIEIQDGKLMLEMTEQNALRFLLQLSLD
jgi:K+-sensing histidine kinase KdpD